jgi:hypothetical protein
MGDLDIAEMFLNFCLHEELQSLCGVDLKGYFPEEVDPGKTLWERWVRCMMGLKILPYVTIKGLLLGLEVVLGNPLDERNRMGWDQVHLNLPGSVDYDPTYPRIWKHNGDRRVIAPALLSYVDDLRVTGHDEAECWCVMHQVSTRLGYLGIQMALRKWRPPSQDPGAWAGSLVSTEAMGVAVRISLEKWREIKKIVQDLIQLVEHGAPLNLKELQSARGSLTYVQRTYPMITPYMKGFHLTIDSWRSGQTRDGWLKKYIEEGSSSDDERVIEQDDDDMLSAPATVWVVPRFLEDLRCLEALFSSDQPPKCYVRSKQLSSFS